MESGIPELTQKGREALREAPPGMTSLCRNILVQFDGNKSVEDVLTMFRGLKGLEEAVQRLFAGGYIRVSPQCKDRIKELAVRLLGPKAPTLVKKIDDIHSRYGERCWEHLDEIDKVARMFYGEVVADRLKQEISRVLLETKK